MARLSGWHLNLLEQITDLVVELCGENGSEVRCSCLDHDEEAEHGELCAWDTISRVLGQLSLVPEYEPEEAAAILQRTREMIEEAGSRLTAHYSGDRQ